MQSLLGIAVASLGQALCAGHACDLALIPEEELAEAVFWAWQKCLRRATASSTPLARQHQALLRFASAFWHPRLLRLIYPHPPLSSPWPWSPPGLASLALVAHRLQHLELSAPALTQLDPLAAACARLCCLSLRGCTALGDQSMAALTPLTSLRALDLAGLPALADGAVFHVAKLPQLAALNLSGTAVGDAGMQFLTYGHRVRAWQASEGVEALPPEAAAWPPLPLEHLQVAGTRVGPPGLEELANLPQLRFLDARYTGAPRSVLGPLQRRFALQAVQAAVLTNSNTVAAAVINCNIVACRCGGCVTPPSRDGGGGDVSMAGWSDPPPGSTAATCDLQGWQAEGVRLLLHFDPSCGLAGLLAEREPSGGRQQLEAAQWAPAGARAGYRQPRQERAGGGRAGRKRPLPWQ